MSIKSKDPIFPKFALADIFEENDVIYVLHTEYPSFILNNETKEIKYFHYMSDDEKESADTKRLIDNALAWAELELDKWAKADDFLFPWEQN